jgi:hypothetical protein
MKSRISLAILFMLSVNILFAQNGEVLPVNRPRNNINMNQLGDASFISINYERLFLSKRILFLTVKAGLGFGASYVDDFTCLTLPHHITMNLGEKRSFLEVGFGGTFLITYNITYNYDITYYCWYPIFGYRFQPYKSPRLNFRIFTGLPINPIRLPSYFGETSTYIPFGVSIGMCF